MARNEQKKIRTDVLYLILITFLFLFLCVSFFPLFLCLLFVLHSLPIVYRVFLQVFSPLYQRDLHSKKPMVPRQSLILVFFNINKPLQTCNCTNKLPFFLQVSKRHLCTRHLSMERRDLFFVCVWRVACVYV